MNLDPLFHSTYGRRFPLVVVNDIIRMVRRKFSNLGGLVLWEPLGEMSKRICG